METPQKGQYIVRTTKPDGQGDMLKKEHLEDTATAINSEVKMRIPVAHRRDLPPLGFADNATIEEDNGIYILKASPVFYSDWRDDPRLPGLFIKEPPRPVVLKSRNEHTDRLTVALDKNDFASYALAKQVIKDIEIESNKKLTGHFEIRKQQHLDPVMAFIIGDYYRVLYPLLAPYAAKIGDKILEGIGGDTYKSLKEEGKSTLRRIKGAIKQVAKHKKEKIKKLGVIFEIPGAPYIELFAKTDDADLIVDALSPARRAKIHTRIGELEKVVNIREAYFKLDTNGNWKFTYLLTEEGGIIGTKETFQDLDKQFDRFRLEPNMGFSIGGKIQFEDPGTET